MCEYLIQTFGSQVYERGIVVGYVSLSDSSYSYDHRALGSLSSKLFYELTVKVFSQKKIPVYGFHQFAFTPLVVGSSTLHSSKPFCVSAYNCCAGIMITASHNPAADNGYKIYWENACQIIPPHDSGISKSIAENLSPWCRYDLLPLETAMESVRDITDEAVAKYMAHATKTLHRNSAEMNSVVSLPSPHSQKCPRVMYTAMHGVGYGYVKELLEHFALPAVTPVEVQRLPDPTFPTVTFPNPEEKGALTIALQEADAKGLSLVMATDPDADRFICCEKEKEGVGTRAW